MPGGFGLSTEVCNSQDIGVNTAGSNGTTITASSTANTKGAWTQLIAATAADCVLAYIQATASGTAGAFFLTDIAIGASGSEKIILPNLLSQSGGANGGQVFDAMVPLHISSGTRISARCQAVNASDTVNYKITTWDGSFVTEEGVAGFDDIGTNTSTTDATQITASSTTNTKGSYTQLIASTARDYTGFLLVYRGGMLAAGDINYLIDIAVGVAGSEVVIVPNLYPGSSTAAVGLCRSVYFPIPIPAGTRIAARMQSSVASNTAVIALYGAYE